MIFTLEFTTDYFFFHFLNNLTKCDILKTIFRSQKIDLITFANTVESNWNFGNSQIISNSKWTFHHQAKITTGRSVCWPSGSFMTPVPLLTHQIRTKVIIIFTRRVRSSVWRTKTRSSAKKKCDISLHGTWWVTKFARAILLYFHFGCSRVFVIKSFY